MPRQSLSFGFRVFTLALALPLGVLACSEPAAPAPTGPVAETVSPKDSPMPYKVLSDETNRSANSVEYHVLLDGAKKHDDVQKLLEYLYRHVMTRREDKPATMSAYVYNDETQYKTPPRSPIAEVTHKAGDVSPKFDNKVPLEFWQQVDQALPHSDKGWKLEKKIERDDEKKTLIVTQPYTEPGEDRWADKLSYNMAINVFTDTAQPLFEKVPELRALTFIGTWKDQEVVRIDLDRAEYTALNLAHVEEQIGELHGRAYLEMSSNRGTDASISKANQGRMGGVYKKMLAALKGKAKISPQLK